MKRPTFRYHLRRADERWIARRLRQRQGGKPIRQFARKIGIPPTRLWGIYHGKAAPSVRVLRFLGLRLALVAHPRVA
jgi:hypothetical protein